MAITIEQVQNFLPSLYDENYIVAKSDSINSNYNYMIALSAYNSQTIYTSQKPNPINQCAIYNPYNFLQSKANFSKDFGATIPVDASNDFQFFMVKFSGFSSNILVDSGRTEVITAHNHITRNSNFDINKYLLTGVTKEFLTNQKTNKIKINDNATLSLFNGTFVNAPIIRDYEQVCTKGAAVSYGYSGAPGTQYLVQYPSGWHSGDYVTIEFDVYDFPTYGTLDFVFGGIHTIFSNGHYSFSGSPSIPVIQFISNSCTAVKVANVIGYNHTSGAPVHIINGYFTDGLNGWSVNGWYNECLEYGDKIVTLPTSQVSGYLIQTYDVKNNKYNGYIIDIPPSLQYPVQQTEDDGQQMIVSVGDCATAPGALTGTNFSEYIEQTTSYNPTYNWTINFGFRISACTVGNVQINAFGKTYVIDTDGDYVVTIPNANDNVIRVYAQNLFDGYITNLWAYSLTTQQNITIQNNNFGSGDLTYWNSNGWAYSYNGLMNVNEQPLLTGFTGGKLIIPSGPKNLNLASKYHIFSGSCNPTIVNWFDFTGNPVTNTIITNDTDYYTIQCYYGQISSELIRYDLSNCYNYGIDYFRLAWFNPLGGWDFFNFNKKSVEIITIDKKTYKKNNFVINGNSYVTNPSLKGDDIYAINAYKRYIITTDWLTDDEARRIDELCLSTEVYWLNSSDYPNYEIPIIITNKEIEVKKTQFGKLIQYQIEFKEANNLTTQI